MSTQDLPRNARDNQSKFRTRKSKIPSTPRFPVTGRPQAESCTCLLAHGLRRSTVEERTRPPRKTRTCCNRIARLCCVAAPFLTHEVMNSKTAKSFFSRKNQASNHVSNQGVSDLHGPQLQLSSPCNASQSRPPSSPSIIASQKLGSIITTIILPTFPARLPHSSFHNACRLNCGSVAVAQWQALEQWEKVCSYLRTQPHPEQRSRQSGMHPFDCSEFQPKLIIASSKQLRLDSTLLDSTLLYSNRIESNRRLW